jgi:hypothetical protein
MLVPAGLFPATAVFAVGNRNDIADSPIQNALLMLAGRELDRGAIARTVSSASNNTVLPEQSFTIHVAGVRQRNLPGEVTIFISYPDADSDGIVDGTRILEQSLKIYRLDEENVRFVEVPNSVVDAVMNRVSARVNHFSIFILAGGAAVENFLSLNVYPNPFRPNSGLGHQQVTFANLPAATKLRIFTVDGRLVDEAVVPAGSNTLLWNGRNRAGQVVASGVYVYVLESASQRQVGKIVVAR